MIRGIVLTRGRVAIVDAEDYEMLSQFNWCVNGGYAYNTACGPMHRFLLAPPSGAMVDHMNGDKLDNRRSNLRICSNSQNQANRQVFRGVSPFKGVVWQKRKNNTGAWKAQLVVRGEIKYLGVFDTDVEAAAAYNAAAIDHFGDFAFLNDLTLPASDLRSHTRRQVNRTNPSGFKGVTYDVDRGKWMAQLTYKGVSHLKKRYPTAEAAAQAYDTVAREVFGPEAITNF